MDIDKLKSDIRAKREVDRIMASSEYRRLQIRKTEVLNIKTQFRDFFKDIHQFACPKDYEPLVASYDTIVVTLKENTERNEQEKGYLIYFILTTPDKVVHSIFADGHAYRHVTDNPDIEISESELSQADLKFHEDFYYGKIIYKFNYKIEGDEREFADLRGLLEWI